MNMTALIIGATGATGKDLVAQLLEDAAFDKVHVFVRRKHLSIMRPPSLIRKETDRFGERVSVKLLQALNKIGLFQAIRPMPTSQVAKAMIVAAKEQKEGTCILEPKDLWRFWEGFVNYKYDIRGSSGFLGSRLAYYFRDSMEGIEDAIKRPFRY